MNNFMVTSFHIWFFLVFDYFVDIIYLEYMINKNIIKEIQFQGQKTQTLSEFQLLNQFQS